MLFALSIRFRATLCELFLFFFFTENGQIHIMYIYTYSPSSPKCYRPRCVFFSAFTLTRAGVFLSSSSLRHSRLFWPVFPQSPRNIYSRRIAFYLPPSASTSQLFFSFLRAFGSVFCRGFHVGSYSWATCTSSSSFLSAFPSLSLSLSLSLQAPARLLLSFLLARRRWERRTPSIEGFFDSSNLEISVCPCQRTESVLGREACVFFSPCHYSRFYISEAVEKESIVT